MGFLDRIGASFGGGSGNSGASGNQNQQAPAAGDPANQNMNFQPQQQAPTNGTSNGQSGAANAPNPNGATMPNQQGNGQPSGQQGENTDPWAKFSKMYDNPSNPDAAPTFSLDDKVLSEVAGSQDFMKGINPELMQKATSGDVSAMMEIMHSVSRNAYKASLSHGSRLTEGYIGSRESFNEKGFGKKVRGELTVNALTGTPNFQNPVVRKQLIKIAEGLQMQHPDAAPEEIANMAKEFVTELSNAIKPATGGTQEEGNGQKAETDFNKWFGN